MWALVCLICIGNSYMAVCIFSGMSEAVGFLALLVQGMRWSTFRNDLCANSDLPKSIGMAIGRITVLLSCERSYHSRWQLFCGMQKVYSLRFIQCCSCISASRYTGSFFDCQSFTALTDSSSLVARE
ncbi:hypothetical protein GOP47_0004633 [Adiantum capillus-veneris]|uniref:Uncharacterized protein n=1 Tax=Adiantum capillus-veneris TaxID=13818 RepID=A0A9D4V7T3_ADICA|nr:hypothetical protein GOP47_0004633 [Adiantum capillus-veneris]